MRRVVLLVAAFVLLVGCGEPPVDLDVPRRGPDQHVLDDVGILDASVEARLAEVSEETGYDVVALAFEDERTSLGQADRGGRLLLDEWDADVVLVTVGRPGDLTSMGEDRSRFFGVYSTDRFTITRSLRERIIFDAMQLPAADNEWVAGYHAAIDQLEAALTEEG